LEEAMLVALKYNALIDTTWWEVSTGCYVFGDVAPSMMALTVSKSSRDFPQDININIE
jgi:hypothetical protein